MSRFIIRSSVDFPAPERPITPTICPCGISTFTASTAVVAETARDLLQVKAHFHVQSSYDGVGRNNDA